MTDKEKPEAIDQEIDKETLVSLLKDKSKEIKSLTTKLTKIEEKYVKIFKEHKNLTKDRETFDKIMKYILDDNSAARLNALEPGNYDYNLFMELWAKKEEEKSKITSSKIETLESKITQLQNKINENKIQYEQNLDKEIKAQKQRISELEAINEKLSKELLDINDVINKKNEEIQQLKQYENDLATLKAEILMKELKNKVKNETNIQYRINENEKLNEILKLKNELELAYDTIHQYKKELDLAKDQINTYQSNNLNAHNHHHKMGKSETDLHHHHNNHHYNNSNNSKDNELQILDDSDHNEKSNDLSIKSLEKIETLDEEKKHPDNVNKLIDIPLQNSTKEDQLNSVGRPKRSNSNPSIRDQMILNQEYLKNVMLKYFLYTARNNLKEANILEQAICTILKMNKQEKDMIENAKRGGSLWSNFFNRMR